MFVRKCLPYFFKAEVGVPRAHLWKRSRIVSRCHNVMGRNSLTHLYNLYFAVEFCMRCQAQLRSDSLCPPLKLNIYNCFPLWQCPVPNPITHLYNLYFAVEFCIRCQAQLRSGLLVPAFEAQMKCWKTNFRIENQNLFW